MNPWLIVAGIFGSLAIAAGAIGDHSLATILDTPIYHAYRVAVHYQLIHAIVLFIISVYSIKDNKFNCFDFAGLGFVLGVLFFCGGLYLWVFTEILFFRYLVPIGGVILMIAWLSLIYAGLSINKR